MMDLSPETIWTMPKNELLKLLDKGIFRPKSGEIHFYAPSFMYYKTSYFCSSSKVFPTISVTGKNCALKCKHCGGKLLETMYSATAPEELYQLCLRLKQEGAQGCLISGGCLPDGSVPVDRFTNTIKRIKRELGFTVFIHVGIITPERAVRLKEACVDAALIDIIGDSDTMREIYRLNLSTEAYEASLAALDESGIAYVPHIIAGLHHGKLKGELKALKMISRYNPSALVIIAFMPIRGTEMSNVTPPEPLDVARVISAARLIFQGKPLVLGCMRPKGSHRAVTDVLAIKAGVDAIAFPAETAIKYAERQGYTLHFSPFCCSKIYQDLNKMP